MRSEDLPQDATPPKIRTAVQAVAEGALGPDEVSRATGLTLRHVHYHLQAARVLGFIERGRGWYRLTDRGREWLRAPAHSAADRALFHRAIAESDHLKHAAPTLLLPESPTASALADRLRLLAPLSTETARRRAETLLRWRNYAIGDDGTLFPLEDVAVAPEAAAAADVPLPGGRPLRYVRARNYGCFRDASADLGGLVVVIGVNASGKTTFLDVPTFVADALQSDVTTAMLIRARNFEEILWFGHGDRFEIVLEFTIPDDLRTNGLGVARYELEVGREEGTGEVLVLSEGLFLKNEIPPAEMIQKDRTPRGWRKVLGLSASGTAWYRSERTKWKTVFQLGSRKLALSQLQEAKTRFPAALWVREVLTQGVQRLELTSRQMREPASPLLPQKFLPDGSNLPLVVKRFEGEDPERFRDWVRHVALAIPDLEGVRVFERPEDKHLYLKLRYRGGLELPAWRVSDGTLRLLALTLIAFLDAQDAVYLIEEPENGIHPQALEILYQALSSCYRSQVLVASHSPVFLGIVPPKHFLIFLKQAGSTRIIPGREHPVLRDWQHEADLGTLFAAGVLTST